MLVNPDYQPLMSFLRGGIMIAFRVPEGKLQKTNIPFKPAIFVVDECDEHECAKCVAQREEFYSY